MGSRNTIVRVLTILVMAAAITWAACGGGGGGSSDQATSTTFNASAAAGDFIKLTLSATDKSYIYENFTTGRYELGSRSSDPSTGEITFTTTAGSGGGSGYASTSELATGFTAPGIGVVLIATHTGATKDKESIVFGVPERTHSLDEIIGLVPKGSGGSADYIYLQFRTNDGGFELGSARIQEEQVFTDVQDIDEDGSVADTITGAPLKSASYSPVYGMPDPVPGNTVDMAFSKDIIDEPSTPFTELASDSTYTILRAWEYDTCDKGEPSCEPTLAENMMFLDDSLEKIVIDSPYFSGIALAMGDSQWSAENEGTYTMVYYFGNGTSVGDQDTGGVAEPVQLVFGNDGGGNGTMSAGPIGGPYSTALTLTRFNDMAEADSLLGNPVSPWPTDGSIPLNGAFGFAGDNGDLGSETFFVFSEGVVFMVSASLTGPRFSGGEPTSYYYEFGAGLKAP
jgi:hypothetical protein